MDRLKPLFPSTVPASDRIMRTEIGGYDQVIALTQHMINQGIDNFYLTLDERGELPEPEDMQSDPTSIQGIFEATFEAPVVLIEANPSNYESVKLLLKLKEGTAKLIEKYDKSTETLKIASLNIEGITATVPANISSLKLDPNTARGKEMRKHMRAGDHSVYQLLVDLASAAWGDARWDYGNWTNDDWVQTTIKRKRQRAKTRPEGWSLDAPREIQKLGSDFRTRFAVFFQLLARDWITAGMLTMGYTKQYDKPTMKPTFDVNNVRYQTYPWTDKDGKGVAPGLDGKSRLNYLCYLENVGQRMAPDPNDPSVSLLTAANQGKRHGNWTDGLDPNTDDPTTFGNFVLSNTCYLEDYFLPKIEKINRLMRLEIPSAWAWIENYTFVYKVGMGFYSEVGKDFTDSPPKSTPDYRFKREKFSVPDWYPREVKDFYSDWVKDIPEGAIEWNWRHFYENHDKPVSSQESWPITVWVWKQYYNHTRVFVVPGSNKIFVHGGNWFRVDYKTHPGWPFQPWYSEFQESAKWSAVFTMRELRNGGLYMDIDFHGVKVEQGPKNQGWSKSKDASDLFAKAAKNFENVVNGLRTSLNGQDRFVMPSSGTFFFKNPAFDHHANLICQLEYKADFLDGSPPVNEDGIEDPDVQKPAFIDFERRTSDMSRLTEEMKKGEKADGEGPAEASVAASAGVEANKKADGEADGEPQE